MHDRVRAEILQRRNKAIVISGDIEAAEGDRRRLTPPRRQRVPARDALGQGRDRMQRPRAGFRPTHRSALRRS